MRTSRPLPQVVRTYFPGAYFVYRNLSLRVRDNGVAGTPPPFSLQARLLPSLAADLATLAGSDPQWRDFAGVSEDRIELITPTRVEADVEPTTWWCGSCGELLNGPLARTGVRGATCPVPACRHRPMVQMNMIFMCSVCHRIDPVTKPVCPDCHDSQNVRLRGAAGRRREYRWACQRHAAFSRQLMSFCDRDHIAMTLKATGGRIYLPGNPRIRVETTVRPGATAEVRGTLSVVVARADVVEIVVGRIPVADLGAYYRRRELSRVEPFRNPASGNFLGLVNRLTTDALIITTERPGDDLALHSLKHALINAAPAVTGLAQSEYGATYDADSGTLTVWDDVNGGSGGCRLLASRRLDRWLAVAHELAECHQVQCDDACRGCLFVPGRMCAEGNTNLNRYLALELLESAGAGGPPANVPAGVT